MNQKPVTMVALRGALEVFKEAADALEQALEAEVKTGEPPADKLYYARDDAAVKVAYAAQQLMQNIDNGQLPTIDTQDTA